MKMTTKNALLTGLTAVTAATGGLLVAFGLHISSAKLGAIVHFEEVTVPVALAAIAAMHHTSGKVNAKK